MHNNQKNDIVINRSIFSFIVLSISLFTSNRKSKLDKVRESSGCVLVHCLGGISRSATVAIAYIMQHMKMTSDDAYR